MYTTQSLYETAQVRLANGLPITTEQAQEMLEVIDDSIPQFTDFLRDMIGG